MSVPAMRPQERGTELAAHEHLDITMKGAGLDMYLKTREAVNLERVTMVLSSLIDDSDQKPRGMEVIARGKDFRMVVRVKKTIQPEQVVKTIMDLIRGGTPPDTQTDTQNVKVDEDVVENAVTHHLDNTAHAQENQDRVRLSIKDVRSKVVVDFKMNKTTEFERGMELFCEKSGRNLARTKFRYKASWVHKHDTPMRMAMSDGDTINAYAK